MSNSTRVTRAKSRASAPAPPPPPTPPTASTQISDRNALVPLKWASKNEEFSCGMKRMFQELEWGQGALTDVTLVSAEGDFIDAHSVILSLSSVYFQRLFVKLQISGKSRQGNIAVVLGNIKTPHLKSLLRFIYQGDFAVAPRDVDTFLRIGNFLGIQGLVSACRQQLGGSRSSTTVIEDDHDYLPPFDYSSYQDYTTSAPSSSSKRGRKEDDLIASAVQMADISGDIDDGDENTFMDDDDDRDGDDFVYAPSSSPNNANGCVWSVASEVSDDVLKRDWFADDTILEDTKSADDSRKVVEYICYHGGRRCNAKLRVETIESTGERVFFTNGKEHKHHRLTAEQKEFVLGMLMKGILKPSEIVNEMRKAGVTPPEGQMLREFIYSHSKKEPTADGSFQITVIRRQERPGRKRKMKEEEPSISDVLDTTEAEAETGDLDDEEETEARLLRSVWKEVPRLTPAELRQNWSIRVGRKNSKGFVKYYICSHAGNSKVNACNAKLKWEEKNGIEKFFSNGRAHCNHIEKQILGLTDDQKKFVNDFIKDKDLESLGTKDFDVLMDAMQDYGAFEVPTRKKVKDYVRKKVKRFLRLKGAANDTASEAEGT